MFAPQHDFFLSLKNARTAARRGDVTEAERWIKCAERHMRLAERLQKLANQETPEQSIGESRPAWLRRA